MLPRRTDFASPPCLGNANHYFSKSRRPAARRTTKPRPTWPWFSAGRTCPIHTRALLFHPQSECCSSFRVLSSFILFLTYLFLVDCRISISNAVAPSSLSRIAAGRHLAPRLRERCDFLYAVRQRRLTRLIFDRGGGITTTCKRQIFKMLLIRAGKYVVVGGPGRHAGRRCAGHHAGQCCIPPVRRRF